MAKSGVLFFPMDVNDNHLVLWEKERAEFQDIIVGLVPVP